MKTPAEMPPDGGTTIFWFMVRNDLWDMLYDPWM